MSKYPHRLILAGGGALLMVLLVLLGSSTVRSLPRYSAQYGQDCALCHVNPAGGGMRSSYATEMIIPEELARGKRSADETPLSGKMSETVSVGADLRTLLRYTGEREHRSENNFIQMQGDLYLTIQPDHRYLIYFNQGISSTVEVFGVGYLLPWDGYFKMGRFTPAFGWRFADHTMFTRENWGYKPPVNSDVGLEVGLTPGDLTLTLAMVNGEAGSIAGTDEQPSFVARTESRHQGGGFNLAFGGSFLGGRSSLGDRTIYAAHGYLSRGRLTWVGEWDWGVQEQVEGPDVKSLTTSQDLSLRLVKGLDLRFSYNYRDPDLDLLTGSRTRYGLGFDLMESEFLGLLGMVNIHSLETGTQVSGKDYIQGLLILHFFY